MFEPNNGVARYRQEMSHEFNPSKSFREMTNKDQYDEPTNKESLQKPNNARTQRSQQSVKRKNLTSQKETNLIVLK